MTGRRTKLTPEVQQKIVEHIRAGAYAWVAAQAAGVSPATFRIWMRRGEQSRREPFFSFFSEVRRAQAEARLAAEIEVRKTQPFNWLRYGPGRERPGEPGWTESSELNISGRIVNVIEEIVFPQQEDGEVGKVSDGI